MEMCGSDVASYLAGRTSSPLYFPAIIKRGCVIHCSFFLRRRRGLLQTLMRLNAPKTKSAVKEEERRRTGQG